MRLTREQRVALKSVYDRGPKWWGPTYPASYRAMRANVVPELCGNTIMIQVGPMWLGIEPDGYTHS